MPCFHPLRGWENPEICTADGKKKIFFFKKPGPYPGMVECPVPCGQCRGCRHAKATEWAIRGTHEASLYDSNAFITLTICGGSNPRHKDCTHKILSKKHRKTLVKSDFQKFLKRLRKHYYGNSKSDVRYLHCGEYGEKFARPHHHAILFNHQFEDQKLFSKKNNYYTSSTLKKLWPYGNHAIGAATYESIGYVARYVLKKINGEMAPAHYLGRQPEYNTMSRRPGIAREWYEKYKTSDVFPRDYIALNGHKLKVPKYYNHCYELTNPEEYSILREMRITRAKQRALTNPQDLIAAEKIQIANDNLISRNFETGSSH